MGNLLSCSECPAPSRSTVFTFSEPLVLKITEGVEPEPEPIQEGQSQDINERDWMEKILCIDNAHTNAYSLSQEGFNRLLSHIEKSLNALNPKDFGQEKVKKCYRTHSSESIKCSDKVTRFINAVDVYRLKTMKEKYTKPNN